MATFNRDLAKLAGPNEFWPKEVHRDVKVQIVLMAIPAGREIGREIQPADQATFIVAGEAQFVADGHIGR